MTKRLNSRNLPAWFAANPVAANLLMLLIMCGGLLGIINIDKEVTPRFSPHQIVVNTQYPGAGTLEVEQSVCMPIEEAIYDVPGVKHLHGEIRGDDCKIDVEIMPDYPREQVMANVQSRVQSIPNLPKQLEKIKVLPAGRNDDDGVIWVALHGNIDDFTLQSFGEDIRQQLASIHGVSKVRNYGEKAYEISIEISPAKLHQYRLTLDEVADAVRQTSVDAPGGLIKNPDGELVLRVNQRAQDVFSVSSLVIKTLPDGSRIRLDQLATIKDGLDERVSEWRHNGEIAQGWEVHTTQDSVAVAREVKAYVEKMRYQLPQGLRLITWWDDSQAYDERIDTLLVDGLSGFLLDRKSVV